MSGEWYVYLSFSSVSFLKPDQIMLIDPAQFRVISDLLQKECKGRWRVDTLTMAATAAG